MFQRILLVAVTASIACAGVSHADITLERVPIDGSSPVLLLKGEFTTSDNPGQLAREVVASGAKLITLRWQLHENTCWIDRAISCGRSPPNYTLIPPST